MSNLDNLKAGETAVYFTGTSIAKANCEDKFTAYQMYMRDEAELTQKRSGYTKEGLSIFDYRVTKRKEPPRKKVIEARYSYSKKIAGE